MNDGLTRDAYLGGRLTLWQPARGYRAGIDPVLLAAACPAGPGESVLELGCGVGTAALCLAVRVEGLRIVGLERQPDIAEIARRNAIDCDLPLEVITCDLQAAPPHVRQRSFDHVIANPPYFRRDESHASGHAQREAAMGEETPLSAWLSVASRRLAPRGWLTLIHRAERLSDILGGLAGLGSVEVQPLAPREGREARLVIVRARKGGRAPLRLHAPLVLHKGSHHVTDGDDYTPAVSAVLRQAIALPGFGAAPYKADTKPFKGLM
ncbi:tRNA1(Val) (adenine(37)-N6)-methyltransferase [Tropicimonas isoalkanivorans]|uniref:tRNA1(Val) A37 N6-methylase TrmN6 n=1 Tax=Tropicimonas isoalkanivorans TaxID=441112 RepID=A0A1I1N5B6_9RHOB|nr:methyltransferase domain-containing protein [Tropicimonas isoalkanivorans]SFC92526.1 tRNA1(Val) A37 N6-methylase TrmN6 [Tropicimonas isoalkanivorans]